MKICYIANIRFPSERANSTQIVQMCHSFANLGNEVDLIVNSRPTHIVESPEKFYGFPFNFKYKRVYVPNIAKYGKLFFGIATLFFCINSISIIRGKKYDLLYCRSEWVLAFIEILFPKRLKIYESHEAKFSKPVRFLIRRGVKIVVISEGIKEVYVSKGVSEKQILVAHDGIDESFFLPPQQKNEVRDRLGLPYDAKIAMYIGGFDAWKGIETFFQASTKLSDVLFVAIGGKQHEVEKYKKQYPLVHFLGSLPYRELKDNQQAADVLVIPNTAKNKLSSEYTSPLKLFAHMASKVPLVISNIPSLTNVLSEKTATLFISDDEVSLAKAIANSLQSQYSQTKADRAYNKALEYTWSKRAQKILSFLA